MRHEFRTMDSMTSHDLEVKTASPYGERELGSLDSCLLQLSHSA